MSEMSISIVLGLLIGTLHGITVPSSNHFNIEHPYSLMISTLQSTKLSTFNLF